MIIRKLVTQLGFDVREQDINKAENKISKFKNTLKKVAKAGAVALGAAITAIGVASVKAASDMEMMTTQFEVMLGSAGKAESLMGRLTEFSASTPFALEDLAKGTENLLAFGVAENEVIDTMRMLGDTAGGNREKLNALVSSYGKVQVKGKASLEELNMMAERGLPIFDQLAENLEVTKEEFFDMVSAGEVGADDVTEAFEEMTSSGGMFFDGMEKQSKTLQGVWSTLKDNLKLMAADWGSAAVPILKRVTSFTSDMINNRGTLGRETNALKTASKEYYDVVRQLEEGTEDLTEKEKGLLDLRKESLSITLDVAIQKAIEGYKEEQEEISRLQSKLTELNAESTNYSETMEKQRKIRSKLAEKRDILKTLKTEQESVKDNVFAYKEYSDKISNVLVDIRNLESQQRGIQQANKEATKVQEKKIAVQKELSEIEEKRSGIIDILAKRYKSGQLEEGRLNNIRMRSEPIYQMIIDRSKALTRAQIEENNSTKENTEASEENNEEQGKSLTLHEKIKKAQKRYKKAVDVAQEKVKAGLLTEKEGLLENKSQLEILIDKILQMGVTMESSAGKGGTALQSALNTLRTLMDEMNLGETMEKKMKVSGFFTTELGKQLGKQLSNPNMGISASTPPAQWISPSQQTNQSFGVKNNININMESIVGDNGGLDPGMVQESMDKAAQAAFNVELKKVMVTAGY